MTGENGDDVEYEIRPISGGRFQATFYSYKPLTKWQAPQIRTCSSEREAMVWINSRLVIRGFEPAYDLDALGGD